MIIEVTQDDITLGQAPNNGLSRGASCPIARAVARTLGVPLADVYTSNGHVEVYWTGRRGWQSSLSDYNVSTYGLDAKGENFIAQADNADGHGCSGSDSPKPMVLTLRQTPLHCPVPR